MIVKVLGTESSVTTADDIDRATCVRLLPSSNSLITRADSDGTTLGTFTVLGGVEYFAAKDAGDTLASNNACKMVKVAFAG